MALSLRKFGFSGLLLMTAGCAQMCAAEDVAMGVARLTTLNADALVNALNADEHCGFENMLVKLGSTVEGEVGSIGTLTLTVTDCELDFGNEGVETSRNCADEVTKAYGKAKVSATKTITGHLTGNMLSPIIPEGPDSALVTISATFENFHAERGEGATMTWISGGLSGRLQPRLATGQNGACAIQTSNNAFEAVSYSPTKALLKSGDREIEVDIDASSLEGQYGLGPRGENLIKGTMSVWGKSHSLPPEGDEDGLDPEYDAAKFIEKGFACKEGLAEPLSYSCDQLPGLAQNAARSLVNIVGAATSLLEKESTCGFSAAATLGTAEISGTSGGPGTLSVHTSDCTVTLPADTLLSQNCVGTKTFGGGKLTATSRKTISGVLTGQMEAPILPTSRTSVVYAHEELSFENFKLSSKDAEGTSGPTMSFTGTLSVSVHPVAGEAVDPGPSGPLYVVATPVAAFKNLVSATGTLTLLMNGMTFTVPVEDLEIDAFNGSFDGRSNEISGTLVARAEAFESLPSALLNPAFDQESFDASYECTPGLKEPVPAE